MITFLEPDTHRGTFRSHVDRLDYAIRIPWIIEPGAVRTTIVAARTAVMRSASVVDLQPEQATSGRVVLETQSLIARLRMK